MKTLRPFPHLFFFLTIGLAHSYAGQQPGMLHRLFHHLESVTSPGPLSTVHAGLDQPDGCGKCHQGARGLSNTFCLDCHKDIAGRLAGKTGPHGVFKGECFECHKEHQGRERPLIQLNEKKFDHGSTRYPLAGAHRKLACARCHTTGKDRRTHYLIGLPQGCTTCHDNPHGAASRACTDCHTQDGWRATPLKFDHQAQTRFPLRGQHARLACASCHKDSQALRNTPTLCAGCHPDPHAGQFKGQPCEACHDTAGFKRPNLKFDHATRTRFTLAGRHAAVTCERCHAGMKEFRASTSCAACHADPHQGQFGGQAAECQACHRPTGWTGKDNLFQHATMTRFPLTGRHARVSCQQCHRQGKFRDTPIVCAACHKAPHQEHLNDCGSCHTVDGFGKRANKFDHNRQTRFPLIGPHAAVNCVKCHTDKKFRVPGITCASCHADVEKFSGGTHFPKIAPGKPDPMHGSVKCADCHQPTDKKADPALIRQRCIACHNPQYGVYFDESRQVIAERLKHLPPAITQDPEKKSAAEAIQRLGAHNVIYAAKLLDALGAGVSIP